MGNDVQGIANLPSPEELIAALRDAGWLLEQDAHSVLEKLGFHSVIGKAYPDPDDSSASREIDVMGYRQLYRHDELSMSVGVRVIAECKQSDMPYVLIGRPPSAYEKNRPRMEQDYRFPNVEIGETDLGGGRKRLHSIPARDYLGLSKLEGNPWNDEF